MSKGFAVAAGLAGLIAIVATLPMFGVWRSGIGFIILALPALSALTAIFGNIHTHVAIATLLATWLIYFAVLLFVAKIVRVLRAR